MIYRVRIINLKDPLMSFTKITSAKDWSQIEQIGGEGT